MAAGRTLAVLALLALAALLFAAKPHQTWEPGEPPVFLTRVLGAPASPAHTLSPAPGTSVILGRRGITVSSADGAIALVATGAGEADWQAFDHGGTRRTDYGTEAVTVSTNRAEEFLVVGSHQHSRTWSWRLRTGRLIPRLGDGGTVGFLDGRRVSDTYLQPVKILSADGRDITPPGSRWSLARRHGGWWLELRLDDSGLPTPYVIDPGIVLRSSTGSNTAGAGTTSVVLNTPAGVALKDLLVAQVTFTSAGAGTTITPPASWTLIRRNDATNVSQATYYHTATASEPASYTWTIGSAQRASGGIIAYVGVNDAAPIDVSGGAVDTTGTSTAVAAPSVTTTAANDELVGFFGVRTGATFTPPAGMTEEWDTSGSTFTSSEAADVLQAAAGASGTKTATSSTGANWIGQLVALKADVTKPTNALSVTSAAPAGSSYRAGNTVYYRGTGGGAGGSFQLTNTVTDAGSGPASASFPALGGTTTGWTHTAQTVTTPAGGPYATTNAFTWTEGATSAPTDAVTSTDNASNTSTATTLTFTNDSTAPTGAVTSPAASANVRGTIAVASSSAADGGSGVASAQFQRSPAGANTWTTIGTDLTSAYSVNWNTTGVTDGLYDLRVILTDRVGNTFTSALVTNVLVDNTTPTNVLSVGSNSPGGSAFGSGTTVYYRGAAAGNFQLSNAVSDAGSGPASSYFPALGGTTTGWTHTSQTITTPTGGPYTSTSAFTWASGTTSSPTEGVRGADNAGNTKTTTLTFTNDSTAPTGSVSTPTAGANIKGSSVTVSSNSADGGSGVASAQFSYSPAGLNTWTTIGTDTTSAYSVAWDTTAVADGLYDLRVVTTDNVGNTFASALVTNVRVDNTAPTGSLTAPSGGANLRGAAVTVSSNSADGGSGVASAVFQRSPAGAGTWTTIATDTTAPYSVSWDTTAVSDGLYDLRVVTTDNAGNTFNSALATNVRVDNTAPTGSVTAPATNANVTGSSVTISSNSADGGSGVASAVFQRSPAGAGTWSTIGTAIIAPYSVSWDTTAVSDGLYDLRVVTTDNAGNTFNSALATNVRVDNTAPTGEITAPSSGADVRGATVTVSSDSADAGSGIASALFQRSPAGAGTWTTIGTDTTSPYSVAWDTTSLADGLYDLRVITTNNVGNAYTSAVVTNVRVDNTAPTGSITTPTPSGEVGGASVTISSNSADGGSGVASAQFSYSPAGLGTWTTIATATTSPYSVAWDTTSLTDGLYDLRVVTTDNAGNTFNSALITNVRVDNTAPTGSLTAPASGAIVRGTSVSLTSSSADGGSGVASALFQRSPAGAGTWTTIGTDTTSPYSVAWDTTAVSDGLYDLRVVTTDKAGNTFTSALIINVRVDNTAPTGSITTPAASTNVSGSSVTVSSDSADGGSGVASALFQRSPAGAGTWTTIGTDTTSPYSVSWNTTTLADGLYDLRVVTADNASNTFTSALITNVRVDNTAPTGSITAPSSGADVGGAAVTISSNSADAGSGVASALFQRSPAGANTWTTIGTDTTSPYSVSWNTTPLADGLYDLRVVTADNAGNNFTSALITNVRVDNTAPTGSLTAPASGTIVRGTSVSVTSSSADGGSGVASAVFQRSPAGAGTWTTIGTDTTSPYSVAWDTTAVSDGLYDLRVVTTDKAGNTFNSALATNVRVDNTAPTGSLTAPASGANLNGSSVTVSSDSADGGSGVASAVFQRSPAGANTWTAIGTATTSPYSMSWNTTTLADGLYDLRVVTADNAGNSFTSALITDVRIDNTAPTGSITAPSSGADVGGAAVTISSNSADGGSGVASAQFSYSPAGLGTWTTIATATTSPYSVAWDTTSLTDGLYDLRVVTTDNVGHVFTSGLVTNVMVDNTAPTGSLTAPSSGAEVSGASVTISSNSADGGSGVASAVFQRSPAGAGTWTAIGTDTTSPYSVAWDTTAVSDGLYDLRVVTTDKAGNTFTSALVTNVRADNTAPTGSLTAPASGANLNGSSVTVSSDSADAGSGVASAQFSYSPAGLGTWTSIGSVTTAPYSVIWDTTGVADGLYDLRVVTTDNVGNASSGLVQIRVDNTAPTGDITAPIGSPTPVAGAGVVVSSDSTDGGSGVASSTFEYSPAGAGTWTTIGTATSSPFSVLWDTTDLANGQYDLHVITTDNAGNVFTSSTMSGIHVDNSAPALSFGSFTNASATGNTVYYLPGVVGGFTVTATPWKHSPPVDHVQFPNLGTGWTGGGPDTTTPYQAAYSFNGSETEPGAGNNVTVVDTFAGSSLPAPFTVSADATPPTSSIACDASACSNGWYPGAVSVSLSASDTGSGVAEIRYTTDGSDPTPTNGFTYAGPFPVSSTSTIKFRAYDQLGNEEAVVSRSIQIDSNAPTGAITAPAAGAIVYGPLVAVSSDSSDTGGSGVASAAFQRAPSGTGIWTTTGTDVTAPYSVSWNTTGLAPGLYDLRVVTTDNAGNTSTSAVRTVRVPVAFTFKVGRAKTTKHGTRVLLSVPVRGSVASTVQAILYRGKKVAFRWRGKVHAGARNLKLSIPMGKLKRGRYTLVLSATASGGRRIQRKVLVKIPKL